MRPPRRPSTAGHPAQTEHDDAEGDQRRPDVHQHHGSPLAVAAFQQPVMQVLFVGDEPPSARICPADEGEHKV